MNGTNRKTCFLEAVNRLILQTFTPEDSVTRTACRPVAQALYLVSAMLVAITIFLTPGGVFLNTCNYPRPVYMFAKTKHVLNSLGL